MKYWFALLSEWQKEGGQGFNLPFINGGQKYLPETSKVLSIEELLIDILQSDTSSICIKYYLTTEDIILEILNERKKLLGEFHYIKAKCRQNFF